MHAERAAATINSHLGRRISPFFSPRYFSLSNYFLCQTLQKILFCKYPVMDHIVFVKTIQNTISKVYIWLLNLFDNEYFVHELSTFESKSYWYKKKPIFTDINQLFISSTKEMLLKIRISSKGSSTLNLVTSSPATCHFKARHKKTHLFDFRHV